MNIGYQKTEKFDIGTPLLRTVPENASSRNSDGHSRPLIILSYLILPPLSHFLDEGLDIYSHTDCNTVYSIQERTSHLMIMLLLAVTLLPLLTV